MRRHSWWRRSSWSCSGGAPCCCGLLSALAPEACLIWWRSSTGWRCAAGMLQRRRGPPSLPSPSPCRCYPRLQALVLVGDHQQLPATVLSPLSQRLRYNRSTFERLKALGLPSVLLDRQYRMHPHISAWPRAAFYGGRVRSRPLPAAVLATGSSAPKKRMLPSPQQPASPAHAAWPLAPRSFGRLCRRRWRTRQRWPRRGTASARSCPGWAWAHTRCWT
jgi:hypothetical protein